jgi:hypothetical protein
VDNWDGDKMTPSLYDYDKGRSKNSRTTIPRMRQPEDPQLEELKEILAEAEDLCIEFAIAMRREAHDSLREVERLSKELDDLAAKRVARTKQP